MDLVKKPRLSLQEGWWLPAMPHLALTVATEACTQTRKIEQRMRFQIFFGHLSTQMESRKDRQSGGGGDRLPEVLRPIQKFGHGAWEMPVPW